MTEQEECVVSSDSKILSYEHQVTTIQQDVDKCDENSKDEESYLKMLRGTNAQTLYPYESCVCVGCGNMFTSPDHMISHWEQSPKCNADKTYCTLCKDEGVKDPKICKHYPGIPRLMLVDASQVVSFDQAVPSESNQNDFNSVNTDNPFSMLNMRKSYKDTREREEKAICPMPPPPSNDPQKPLPYRIDFLLNSGVIKHARMNGKNNHSPLYFEKKRPRKPRTHFTDSQVEDLEKVFDDKKYLSATERQTIANDLNLQEEQVKNWFQNRRSRWRKDCKDNAIPVHQELENMKTMHPLYSEPTLAQFTENQSVDIPPASEECKPEVSLHPQT